MQRVEKELARLIEEIDYDEVTRLFSNLNGGKRLRAKLILKIASDNEQAPLLGAIVEMIHAASLLHDDVIDDAMTRRGESSVNATEGSKTAVMLGDILYSKAFSELVVFDKEIAKIIASSVTSLSKGELLDVNMAKEFNESEETYLNMLYLKTATLIEASAAASAMLAKKDVNTHKVYGKNLGLSFQIIDDILDITTDSKTLGKPAMNDFVEGKCTLPYIYLYEKLEENDRKKLVSLHAKKLCADEISWIKEKMMTHQSVEESFKLAEKLSLEAQSVMSGDEDLVNILQTMIKRNY
ncbi:polyprenyl synthetase family protein [Sulfurimonas sp.]|jgi:octaprenyl-diphosphate synthase|uniref:polyprenyl synthetase family protein n=1 Tax=Sulfurimonas sp. TaxID=2022749 RepID=UPI0025F8418A|nr:polyprenyl synthetase family protein [Sulfurimonas sp.]MBT5934458.1 polyprenyl synthetase family protein [Sulfurimonas sp.]